MTKFDRDTCDGFSKLSRLCETEHLYRCGCEYLSGTDGSGEDGEHLSKKLGLSIMKLAADSGHTDVQF
jgi:hypothetical protein